MFYVFSFHPAVYVGTLIASIPGPSILTLQRSLRAQLNTKSIFYRRLVLLTCTKYENNFLVFS